VRYFRRLPLLLRVAFIVGLLLPLAWLVVILVILIPAFISSLSSATPQPFSYRLPFIGVNLISLSLACSFAVNSYSVRFRRPQGGTFPLQSWQSQVRAIALLAALPLGALAMTLLLPPGDLAFFLSAGISLLAVIGNMLALLWAARVWGVGP
jgi:hypothetical protein